MEKIILYTIHCPKCNVLQKKLDQAGVKYEVCTDINIMEELGITSVPVLSTPTFSGETVLLDFGQAINWLKGLDKE